MQQKYFQAEKMLAKTNAFLLITFWLSCTSFVLSGPACARQQQLPEAEAAISPVTVESLLNEMVNRETLVRLAAPAYTCRQFSSYDREAVAPDQPGWYANWDRSHFLGLEEKQGRKEYVLMDAEGPGAVVRFWSTWTGGSDEAFYNGLLRIYLDGKKEPVIERKIADVISGGYLAGAPLSQSLPPQVEVNGRAHNLYFPIPYSTSCKITYESPNIENPGARSGEALYYQINYRTYEEGTAVESFSLEVLQRAQPVVAQVLRKLTASDRGASQEFKQQSWSGTLSPMQERVFSFSEKGAIRSISLKLEGEDLEQALRSTIMEISFDGQRTAWSPVGDFFGTGYKLNPHQTWYTEVTKDGVLKCFWVMPFAKSAKVTVRNMSGRKVKLTDAEVCYSAWDWDDRSLHFYGAWRNYPAQKTGKNKSMNDANTAFDVNFIEIKGQGHFVGDVLTVFNATDAWWGEGDEKIYVDGESFPSHFGTGTEDYYGYAWCRPEFFEAPFHAQPNGEGNMDGGFAVNSRFRALDAIPFKKSFKFDMELWHWRNTRLDFAPTTFWYARPGAVSNVAPAPKEAQRKVTKSIEELAPIRRVEGGLEGETFKVKEVTGGATEVQSLLGFIWSNNGQLWWKNGAVGDRLVLEFTADQAGRYNAKVGLTKAIDYGIFKIAINGETVLEELDLFNPSLGAEVFDLGECTIKEGANQLEVTILGANEKAVKKYMFGLDFLLLQ